MNCTDVQPLLHDYMDGGLGSDKRREVELHLAECPACRHALDSLQALRKATGELPREMAPSRDLWGEIARKIETNERTPLVTFRRAQVALAIAAAVALLVSFGWWQTSRVRQPDWAVAALAGLPRVGDFPFQSQARLRVGQWLETDSASSAKLEVGSIGEVRLEPNSRVRLIGASSTDHRLELARGTLNALIWSPPRLFFVETSAATAIDLGCAYSLTVDEQGSGLLRVTAGYVALERDGNESVISAGMVCATRRGIGPGTPFRADAPTALREALARFDFNGGNDSALESVLAVAGEDDGITLWHLLARGSVSNRGRVFDTLAVLRPPPAGVTRDGIIHGDQPMREIWGAALGMASPPKK